MVFFYHNILFSLVRNIVCLKIMRSRFVIEWEWKNPTEALSLVASRKILTISGSATHLFKEAGLTFLPKHRIIGGIIRGVRNSLLCVWERVWASSSASSLGIDFTRMIDGLAAAALLLLCCRLPSHTGTRAVLTQSLSFHQILQTLGLHPVILGERRTRPLWGFQVNIPTNTSPLYITHFSALLPHHLPPLFFFSLLHIPPDTHIISSPYLRWWGGDCGGPSFPSVIKQPVKEGGAVLPQPHKFFPSGSLNNAPLFSHLLSHRSLCDVVMEDKHARLLFAEEYVQCMVVLLRRGKKGRLKPTFECLCRCVCTYGRYLCWWKGTVL